MTCNSVDVQSVKMAMQLLHRCKPPTEGIKFSSIWNKFSSTIDQLSLRENKPILFLFLARKQAYYHIYCNFF